MPTTTTYGYKKPITGERGYFTSLEHNIDRTDSHNHDGLNSPLLPTKSLQKGVSNILAASWAAVSGKSGLYYQDITLPAGYDMSTIAIKVLVNGGSEDGAELFLSIEKLSSTSYRIFINDNTLSLKALYA